MEDVIAPSTAWQRVVLDIVQQIRAGTTPVGARIPSYRRLIAEYATSLGTVKRAVGYLQDQSIVKGVQGSGVFVMRVPDADPTFAPDSSEDVAGRLERVEDTVSDLGEDQRDVHKKIGLLEARLRDLYSRTGHRYPAGDGRAEQPQHPRRKTADG